MKKGPNFITLKDEFGNEYFSYNVAKASSRWWPDNMTGSGTNLCSFLFETMPIQRKLTGRFSTDLTDRDDIILAVLSLMLVLVIESILATILLRTRRGKVSNFGFSVKHFIDLARGFKFRYILNGRPDRSSTRTINTKLLAFAASVLLVIFSVEVLVLVLTTPKLVPVTNSIATFEMFESVFPNWKDVRDAGGFFAERPCSAISLTGVKQQKTALSACLASTISAEPNETFELSKEPVNVDIITEAHQFGAEYVISIGDLSANYSARAYFTMEGGSAGILRKRRYVTRQEPQTEAIHLQLVACLFNIFKNRTGDDTVTLEMLNKISPKFITEDGQEISIIQVNRREKFKRVTSNRRITSFKAVIPHGASALHFARRVLKASVAVGIGGPDIYDLKMGTGQIGRGSDIVWYEESRTLNWLSLTMVLSVSVVVMVVLRTIMKPTGTTEIAGFVVNNAIGASPTRTPFEIAMDKQRYFTLARTSDTSYKSYKSSTLSSIFR